MAKVGILGGQLPIEMRRSMKAVLEASGHEADIVNTATRNASDWIDDLRGYDAIIPCGEKLPGVVFEKLGGSLKLVSRCGVGTDEIDKVVAAGVGTAVCNAAGVFSSVVAELALGMMLCLMRHIHEADNEVRAGDWSRFFESKVGTQIEGKTVGLIGFGDIAKSLAKMLTGFDCKVIAYDLYWNEEAAKKLGVEYADVETIKKEADIISLHVPSTTETNGMINKEFLSAMKKNAVIINTGRGKLIVEEDLADALNNHVIAGAALDVFCKEPPESDNPLFNCPNTLLLPHIGAGSEEALEKVEKVAVQNVIDFFAGKTVKTILNPDYIKNIK